MSNRMLGGAGKGSRKLSLIARNESIGTPRTEHACAITSVSISTASAAFVRAISFRASIESTIVADVKSFAVRTLPFARICCASETNSRSEKFSATIKSPTWKSSRAAPANPELIRRRSSSVRRKLSILSWQLFRPTPVCKIAMDWFSILP